MYEIIIQKKAKKFSGEPIGSPPFLCCLWWLCAMSCGLSYGLSRGLSCGLSHGLSHGLSYGLSGGLVSNIVIHQRSAIFLIEAE